MGKLKRPHERTDGRRKGYKPFRSRIGDRLEHDDPETYQRLLELRGPVRKPRRSRPHTAPAKA